MDPSFLCPVPVVELLVNLLTVDRAPSSLPVPIHGGDAEPFGTPEKEFQTECLDS
jgi:hypothetical protein